jgi:2'-5' RNA ligase
MAMVVAFDQPLRVPLEPRGPVKLFFSVFPDPQTAARIWLLARHLRRDYGLKGRPLLVPRLHCTLCDVDDRNAPWQGIVAKAQEAAANATSPPFRVSFNGVMSFAGKKDHYPLVLVGDDGVVGLTRLSSSLCTTMRRVGLRPREPSGFNPHVTMLYDRRRIGELSVEPICWTVNEIVLVLSLIGRTKYYSLGRWQLRGRPLPTP